MENNRNKFTSKQQRTWQQRDWAEWWELVQPSIYALLILFLVTLLYFGFRNREGLESIGFNLISEFAGIALTIVLIDRLYALRDYIQRKDRLERLTPLRLVAADQISLTMFDSYVATDLSLFFAEHGGHEHLFELHQFVDLPSLIDRLQRRILYNHELFYIEELYELSEIISQLQKHRVGISSKVAIPEEIANKYKETAIPAQILEEHAHHTVPDEEIEEIHRRLTTLQRLDKFLSKLNPKRLSIPENYENLEILELAFDGSLPEPEPIIDSFAGVFSPEMNTVFTRIMDAMMGSPDSNGD